MSRTCIIRSPTSWWSRGNRIKQPRKPVRFEQHTPFEERIFGKQITLEELRLRIEYRKGF